LYNLARCMGIWPSSAFPVPGYRQNRLPLWRNRLQLIHTLLPGPLLACRFLSPVPEAHKK
jgi:hypothetical protein